MGNKGEIKEIQLGCLFAEVLEKEAALMPPSHRLEAASLRRQAAYWKMMLTKVNRVWREIPDGEASSAKQMVRDLEGRSIAADGADSAEIVFP